LKPLRSHLRYKCLSPNNVFPVIINTKLDDPQFEKLLDVLKKHTSVMGYSIDDIKGINPSVCMHRQPQRRLNPNMQEVAKKEVASYLMLGFSIISPIVNR